MWFNCESSILSVHHLGEKDDHKMREEKTLTKSQNVFERKRERQNEREKEREREREREKERERERERKRERESAAVGERVKER